MDILKSIDLGILNLINNLHNPILSKVMIFITTLGNAGLVWIIITLILIITPKYRKVGIMSAMALILNVILGEVIFKNLIQRSRPFMNLNEIELLIKAPTSYSFPSGHTASSFAAFGVIGKQIKKSKYYLLSLAILIAFSRMYLYVHYPSDIAGGVILGLISAFIINKAFEKNKKLRREYNE